MPRARKKKSVEESKVILETSKETDQDKIPLTDEEICTRVDLEYLNAFEFKKPNISEWHENENLLYGKKPKTISKRSNIMVQLMAGFEDTLLSKIKHPVLIMYKPTEEADTIKARKVTSLWELESSVSHEDWEYKDLLTKKSAMVSGRGILKIYAMYPYSHKLDPVDHYDFLVDPLTNGLSLESARYLGQDNIIKSKWELEANSDYDQSKVKELIAAYSETNSESPDNPDMQKSNRFAVMGMNYSDYFQAGDPSYKLLEWYTTILGVRYCILLDKEKRIIIKKRKLESITGSIKKAQPFWPFESWAYYPDLFNFWSPSPMSRIRELFQLRNVSLNQMFDNNESKNRPMRSFDPKVYTNPGLLAYSPDRLIPVAAGRDPSKGLYTFQAQDIIEPEQFDQILEKLAGKITGVTPSGAGLSDKEKVGIYYGDQQEVEKRMTLFEISYNRAHLRLGQKYLKYLEDRLDSNISIKILGEDGVEKNDITQEDLGDFDITITGGLSKASMDALQKKQKNDFLKAQAQNPLFNKKFQLRLGLALNDFSQDDIKSALEPNEIDEKQSIRASEDIQKILLGKKIRPYLKAEIVYMQKIFDFIYEKEMKKEDEDKLIEYLDIVRPIVIKNMVNKARSQMALRGMLQVPAEFAQEGVPPVDGAPLQIANEPMSPAGIDQSRVQEIPAESQQTYERGI